MAQKKKKSNKKKGSLDRKYQAIGQYRQATQNDPKECHTHSFWILAVSGWRLRICPGSACFLQHNCKPKGNIKTSSSVLFTMEMM